MKCLLSVVMGTEWAVRHLFVDGNEYSNVRLTWDGAMLSGWIDGTRFLHIFFTSIFSLTSCAFCSMLLLQRWACRSFFLFSMSSNLLVCNTPPPWTYPLPHISVVSWLVGRQLPMGTNTLAVTSFFCFSRYVGARLRNRCLTVLRDILSKKKALKMHFLLVDIKGLFCTTFPGPAIVRRKGRRGVLAYVRTAARI